MRGFVQVFLFVGIIVLTLVSLVLVSADLWNACWSVACDLSKTSLHSEVLLILALIAGWGNIALASYLVYFAWEPKGFVFKNNWTPADLAIWGWCNFVPSVLLMVLPGLICLGFYARGIPISFGGAFWVSFFLHANAGGLCQVVLLPSREEMWYAGVAMTTNQVDEK